MVSFWKPKARGQIVLPDRSVLKGQKLMKNAKIGKFKCDILGDFQTMWHCDFEVFGLIEVYDGDVWGFRFRFLGSLWNEKLPLKCSSSEEVAYALYWRADFPVHLRPLHTRPWGPKRGFYRRLGTTYQYAGIKRCLDGGAGRSTSWRKWLRSASKYWTAIPCRLFACPKRNTCLQGLFRSWNRKKKILSIWPKIRQNERSYEP